MFSQLAKWSSRVFPVNLFTDHVHYVKNQRLTVLRRNKNLAFKGGIFSHHYILVIRKFIDFMPFFRNSVWFAFSCKQFSSPEFGICNIWLARTAEEFSYQVVFCCRPNLRSVQGTELSAIIVICLLGSFLISTLNLRCWTDCNTWSEILWSVRRDLFIQVCKLIFISSLE